MNIIIFYDMLESLIKNHEINEISLNLLQALVEKVNSVKNIFFIF